MPPIKPSEVAAKKISSIPEFVFDAFNELIAKNFSGNRALVMQNSAIRESVKRSPNPLYPVTPGQIFAEGWLDVEDAYREAGWKVLYDKPAYNESHEANFTFSR